MNQIPNFNGDGRFNFYNSFKERTNWFAASTIVGGMSSCSCLYIGRLCWFVRSSAPYIQNDVQPEKFRLSAHSLILIGHRSRIEIDWNEPNERQWYRLSPAGIRISSGFNWLVLIPRRAFKDNDEYQRAVEIVGNKLKRKQWWFLGNK